MPVYKLVEMPYDELLGWFAYFEARPVGWREDDRTMKLLQVQGVKAKPVEIFQSLAQLTAAQEKKINEKPPGFISGENLKKSAMFLEMLGAVNGDKLEFE